MRSHGTVENLVWLDPSLYERRASRAEAEAFCRSLAAQHYENFTVVSYLLPRQLKQHFCNIYAFCRVSDDLADELGDAQASLARLEEWKRHLDLCYEGEVRHPVFVALEATIRRFDIPIDPFADLLLAFRQDQVQTRYRDWDELLGYCRKSANPVGRLVLYLCGHRDAGRQRLSDATCTALQLTNFWQDVDRDHLKGRVYLPQDVLAGHGYTESMLARRVLNEAWIAVMKELIGRTRPLFYEGLELRSMVEARVRLDIELFSRGGLEILRAIEAIGYDTLHRRPTLTRGRELCLLATALARTIFLRKSLQTQVPA